jgi:hypothetical protein
VVALQASLQYPLIPTPYSDERLIVNRWDVKAWQVPLPAAVPAGSMPVVAAWTSFQSELQLVEEELSQYQDCIFPRKHGLRIEEVCAYNLWDRACNATKH